VQRKAIAEPHCYLVALPARAIEEDGPILLLAARVRHASQARNIKTVDEAFAERASWDAFIRDICGGIEIVPA